MNNTFTPFTPPFIPPNPMDQLEEMHRQSLAIQQAQLQALTQLLEQQTEQTRLLQEMRHLLTR